MLRHRKDSCSGLGLMLSLCAALSAQAQSPYAPRSEPAPPPSGLFAQPLDVPTPPPAEAPLPPGPEELLRLPADPPPGYTGPSGVLPREAQESSHFVPVEDRWR